MCDRRRDSPCRCLVLGESFDGDWSTTGTITPLSVEPFQPTSTCCTVPLVITALTATLATRVHPLNAKQQRYPAKYPSTVDSYSAVQIRSHRVRYSVVATAVKLLVPLNDTLHASRSPPVWRGNAADR